MAKITNPPITADFLRTLPIFFDLPDPGIETLLQKSQVYHLTPRQWLSSLNCDHEEQYCFIIEGVICITSGHQSKAESRQCSDHDPFEYLGFLTCGEFFSNGFLTTHPPTGEATLDCVASTPTTLLASHRPTLIELANDYPTWATNLAQRLESVRNHFQCQQEPTRHRVQDFFLRHGFVSSSVVRVKQIDRCLDCNKCKEACTSRHGFSRGLGLGLRLGKLAIQQTCRQCVDHPCIQACSFGALTESEQGDLRISDRCKGCGACAHACQNGAIYMVDTPYTLANFPEPIPNRQTGGMTNVPGLFVAGDVSGAALIKPSMNEAVDAVNHLPPRCRPQENREVLDVVIVGAGPAGLAAALRCKENNLRYVVLEKGRSLATLREYPKNKFIMAEPSTLPLASALWFGDCRKEELLASWQAVILKERLHIREHSDVQRIVRHPDGTFQVVLSEGIFFTENVLICVGKRGSPRVLGLPAETPDRVHYCLTDPDEFAGRHILVIGGGDSAIEAALALADIPRTSVTISYRQATFSRAKPKNRERLTSYQSQGRLRVLLSSTVKAILPGWVRLATHDGELALENHTIFALLGSDPPTPFLEDAGIQVLTPGSPEMAKYAAQCGNHQRAVKCDNCAGYADRACFRACPTGALVELSPQDLFTQSASSSEPRLRNFCGVAFLEGIAEHRARQSHHTTSTVAAALLIVILAIVGLECFLRRTLPEHSLAAAFFQSFGRVESIAYNSGKGFGHWLGYLGTSSMLLTFLYPLHTHLGFLKNLGAQSTWLTVHLWFGFIGATLVTYHAAFKLDRWVGLSCIAMWIVVASGVIGRFLYGKVHSGIGLAEFERESLARSTNSMFGRRKSSRAVRILTPDQNGEVASHGLIVVMLWHEIRDFAALLWLRFAGLADMPDRKTRQQFLRLLSDQAAQQRARHYLTSAKRMLRHWNWVHITFTILMFALAAVHITYGFMYKST